MNNNNRLSMVFFYNAFVMMLWLTSLFTVAAAASFSSPVLLSPLQTASLSPLQLPSRSDIVSALLSHHRNLLEEEPNANNKFDSLNEILSSITLQLPDAQVSQSGVDLTITQTVCRDLNVQDIQISHDSTMDNTTQRIGVEISGVEIACTFRWEVSWGFLGSSSGDGKALSDPTSSISIEIDFVSQDYTTQPPDDVSISSCNANFQIEELEVSDDGSGFVAGIINTFEELLRDTIEAELGNLACEKLSGLGEEGEALDELMTKLSEGIGDYLIDDDAVDSKAVDPLLAEKNAQVPTDEDGNSLWINFLELQNYTLELVNLELNQLVESILGSSSSSTTGEEELGINDFFRTNILNEDGLLVITDPSTIVAEDDSTTFKLYDLFTMSIQSISIGGLDSFQEMNVFDPIGNYTLQNSLKLEYLTLVLEMEVVMQQASSSQSENAVVAVTVADSPDSPPIRETFIIEFSVKDVHVDFSLFLGINTQTLGTIPLGSVIYTANILPCILGDVDETEITSLSVKVSDIVPPAVSGFLDDDGSSGSVGGLDHIISTAVEALFSMYEGVLIRAMPNFFETTLRDLLNGIVEDALNGDDACPKPDDSLDGLVDYRDLLLSEEEAVALLGRGGSPYGDLFRLLYGFLDDIMAEGGGLSWMNGLIVQLTGLQSDEEGGLFFGGDLISETLEISVGGLNAVIELEVFDVKVSNLNSLSSLNLLQPMKGESSVLNNTASMGFDPEPPLRLSTTLLIKGTGDKLEVHNEVQLSLSLKEVELMLEVLAQMMEPSFLNFPLQDVLNLQCWMTTIVKPVLDKYGIRVGEPDSGLVLRNLAMTVAEAQLDMKCISCSSPMMLDLEQAMQSQEGVEDTTEVVNMLFEQVTNIMGGEYIQSNIDQMLNEAAYHCPHSPSYQQNFPGLEYEEMEPVETNYDYSFLIAVIVVIAVVAVSAAIIFLITRWVSRRRHNRWLQTLNNAQKLELARMQQDEKEMEKDLNGRMTSLVLSKEIPCLVRLFMPVVIIGNIALFLSGHLSLGGTVNISGSFAGDPFNVEGFFEFSMATSTIEMWHAGAKALAILIALFSGVWPYTKQLLTLLIWLVPPKYLGGKRRESSLHWLDVLGKWSMVDVFVLLMTLASFRISVESPDHLRFLPEGLYSINMLVVPMWGLYANMLAQLVAQVSSHAIIHYHRKTVRAATKSQEIELNLTPSSDDLGSTPEKLRTHKFKLDYEASTKSAVVRRGVNLVLVATLLSFTILVICGCSLPSFNIDVLGLVGLVVESGNKFEEAKTYYNVFDLAQMIMDQARYINKATDFIGMGTLASLLVITVFLVPLAQAASLLAQWFVPMTKKQRARNTVFNEVLSAWQYMEVYVLSIIIAAWQLGGVSEFMINAYCDELEDTFASLERFGIIDVEDAQCFRVNATVEAASWLLVAASLILCILNHFIGAASVQKTRDDDTPAERRLHTDRWLHNNKPAQSTSADENADRVNTIDEVKEQGSNSLDENVNVSPISPRFTDYYHFATTHRTEEECQENDMQNEDAAVETAVAPSVY